MCHLKVTGGSGRGQNEVERLVGVFGVCRAGERRAQTCSGKDSPGCSMSAEPRSGCGGQNRRVSRQASGRAVWWFCKDAGGLWVKGVA